MCVLPLFSSVNIQRRSEATSVKVVSKNTDQNRTKSTPVNRSVSHSIVKVKYVFHRVALRLCVSDVRTLLLSMSLVDVTFWIWCW